MHFELEPDLADLQSRLLSFVANEIDPITVGVDPESPPAQLRRDIAGRSDRAGYYQLVVPESDGGLGGGPRVITAAREALALSGNPLASLVLGSGPGIMRLADNEEQRATLYEPVLRGEKTAAFAFTEALRTDGSREPTQAVRAGLGNGADGFLVSGAKGFVTGGASSDWLVVVANVPDEGTALLVVDRDADGVSQGDLGASMDGSTHSPFYFDSVPVPESRLLGQVGDGLPRAMQNIDRMRLGVAADCVGWARWVTRATLERIEGPHRSGQPLAEQQQVQAIFADMVADTYAARTSLYQAAEARETDQPTAGTQVAAAKWLASECLHRTVDRAIQLHGAQALLRGHALERLYRTSRSMRIAEGPTELLRLTVARHIRQNGVESL
ncbi:MAG: acyl-CoA dehydrogenase family protein [Chloroflexi bacterium]|nr:acyl-CoA dehydrogenase family protein [Chloroflexota bacterium]MCY3588491.1 acyl-CoA dehydrogenase family protein [Chloroflexota bacterium]MDE2709415.1 acyl-CoA dehydrogenase family protein [Chloroflexota bacterium]